MVGRTPSAERVTAEQAQRLGAFLRQRRTELGWSRDRVGRMTGLSSSTIRSVETAAVHEPGFFTVAALVEALGLAPQTVHAIARQEPSTSR